MTSNEFYKILSDLLNRGLEITLFAEDKVIWHNLNTGMKSHLYIRFEESKQCIVYRARYDETGVITDWEDLMTVVRGCDYGRGFANHVWQDILKNPYR